MSPPWKRARKPEFTRANFDAMYADFLLAVDNCTRETGRNFRRDDLISVWVWIAQYRWINRVGLSVREKWCSQWRVPAVRFWPGGVLPAIITAYPPATPLPPNTIDEMLRYIDQERARITAEKRAVREAADAAARCADERARVSRARRYMRQY